MIEPFYPMRTTKGVATNIWGLEREVEAEGLAIVLAPEGVRHERSWCVRDWGQSTPHLAVVLRSGGGWDWGVDGGPRGHDVDLHRAMLFAEAAVHVVDLERQAESLAPSRPGPLYLLAARMMRRAIGEAEAYREAILMPDGPPKAAAAWVYGVASWPEDGLYQDGEGRQRDPLDVLTWGASWPKDEVPTPWFELALVIVRAARPDTLDVVGAEERRRIAHPAAVWDRVERALAADFPKLVGFRRWSPR